VSSGFPPGAVQIPPFAAAGKRKIGASQGGTLYAGTDQIGAENIVNHSDPGDRVAVVSYGIAGNHVPSGGSQRVLQGYLGIEKVRKFHDRHEERKENQEAERHLDPRLDLSGEITASGIR